MLPLCSSSRSIADAQTNSRTQQIQFYSRDAGVLLQTVAKRHHAVIVPSFERLIRRLHRSDVVDIGSKRCE